MKELIAEYRQLQASRLSFATIEKMERAKDRLRLKYDKLTAAFSDLSHMYNDKPLPENIIADNRNLIVEKLFIVNHFLTFQWNNNSELPRKILNKFDELIVAARIISVTDDKGVIDSLRIPTDAEIIQKINLIFSEYTNNYVELLALLDKNFSLIHDVRSLSTETQSSLKLQC